MFNNENNCASPDASIGIGIQTGNIAAGGQYGCCESNGKYQDVIVTAKIYVEYTDPYGNITPYSSSTCVVPPFSAQSGGYCVSGDGDSQKYQFRIPKNIQLSAEKNFNAVVVKYKPNPIEIKRELITEWTTSDGKGSWETKQNFCTAQGKQLCTYVQLCPNGIGPSPTGSQNIIGDQWVPIQSQTNGNKWIQAGTRDGGKCNPLSTYHGSTGHWMESTTFGLHKIWNICCDVTNENRFGLHIGLLKHRLENDGMGTGNLRSSEKSNKNDVVSVQICGGMNNNEFGIFPGSLGASAPNIEIMDISTSATWLESKQMCETVGKTLCPSSSPHFVDSYSSANKLYAKKFCKHVRYLRIGSSVSGDHYLNLNEVQVYGIEGTIIPITGSEWEIGSDYSGSYTKEKCYNGITNALGCHSAQGSNWALVFDLGQKYCVGSIKIYNRINCCQARINGAVVSVRETSGGADLWEEQIIAYEDIMIFDVGAALGSGGAFKIKNYYGPKIYYSTPVVGKCEDYGGEVITTPAACQVARGILELNGDVTIVEWWDHVPPGCVMWDSTVHFNTNLASTVTCDRSGGQSLKYCICISTTRFVSAIVNAEDSWMDLHAVLDTDQISKKVRVDTDVLPSKPSSSMMYITPTMGKCADFGGELITTRAACQVARGVLGLGGDVSASWNHVPPGCVMWDNSVHFNTNLASTVTCDQGGSKKHCICTKQPVSVVEVACCDIKVKSHECSSNSEWYWVQGQRNTDNDDLAPIAYEHHLKSCVSGSNIIKYELKTINECKTLCNNYGAGCQAFEFGVNYGGATYQAGDCQLQSSNIKEGCDGERWNLDLYSKTKDYVDISVGSGNIVGQNLILTRQFVPSVGTDMFVLAAIIDGTKATWDHDNPIWTDNTVYDVGGEKKTRAFSTIKSNKIRVHFEHGSCIQEFDYEHNLDMTLSEIFASGEHIGKSPGRSAWTGLGCGDFAEQTHWYVYKQKENVVCF